MIHTKTGQFNRHGLPILTTSKPVQKKKEKSKANGIRPCKRCQELVEFQIAGKSWVAKNLDGEMHRCKSKKEGK